MIDSGRLVYIWDLQPGGWGWGLTFYGSPHWFKGKQQGKLRHNRRITAAISILQLKKY